MVKLLQKGLAGWQGFTDMEGEEIPFSTEKVKELCECDPDFMAGLATRIQHVARMGELEDRKNWSPGPHGSSTPTRGPVAKSVECNPPKKKVAFESRISHTHEAGDLA